MIDSYVGDHKECRLFGCYAVYLFLVSYSTALSVAKIFGVER
jgi:hypothetical protein